MYEVIVMSRLAFPGVRFVTREGAQIAANALHVRNDSDAFQVKVVEVARIEDDFNEMAFDVIVISEEELNAFTEQVEYEQQAEEDWGRM